MSYQYNLKITHTTFEHLLLIMLMFISTVALANPVGQHSEGVERSNTVLARCGDGVIQPERGELCDNGDGFNGAPGNSCTSSCVNAAQCGNGTVEIGELCDEGILHNGDSGHLISAPGYAGDLYCSVTCQIAGCGSKTVDPGEDCDFGDHVNGDGCDQNCLVEQCGNGVIQNGEACDNGIEWNGNRPPNGAKPLAGFTNGCNSNCSIPVCGNDSVEVAGGEDCDLGALNGTENSFCTNTCTFIAVCGNGVKELGEGCDQGEENNGPHYRWTEDGAEFYCTPECNLSGCSS